MKKLIISALALVLTFGAVVAQGVGETAPRDGNRTTALLLTDSAGKTDRWESDDAGAAKVALAAGGTVTANQGTSGILTDPWFTTLSRRSDGVELGLAASPFGVSLFDGAGALFGTAANPFRTDPTGTTTQPISATFLPLPTGAATEATLLTIDDDTSSLAGTVSGSEQQVDVITSALPTGASTSANQTTANTSLDNIDTNTTGLAGTVSGSEQQVDIVGPLPAGTNAIGKLTANDGVDIGDTTINNASGASAVNIQDGGNSITVDGTVTSNAGTGTFTNQQTNVTEDYDTGGATETMTKFGIALPASGGSVAGGTLTNPLRTDPTGTTIQPVSDAGGSLTVDGTVTSNIGTTGGLALDATLTGGTQQTKITDGTDTVDVTAAGELEVTLTTPLPSGTNGIGKLTANSGVDIGDVTVDNAAGASAVNIQDGGNTITVDGTVTANAGTGTFATNQIQVAGAATSVNAGNADAGTQRVVLASDQAVVSVDDNGGSLTVDGTITADIGTTGGLSLETTQTDVELNTDSATGFGSTTVTVGTTAILILAADVNRRSALIRNADSNTVLFTGPTSGVTTANGMPMAVSGVPGATGNGGTIIYTHTAAIWGIVNAGTADIRVQTESD